MATEEQITLQIDGIHCASCVASIESALTRLGGVQRAQVNFATNSADVRYLADQTSPDEIISTIKDAGFGARLGRPDPLTANRREQELSRRRFLRALIATLPLMVLAMMPMVLGGAAISHRFDAAAQAVLAAVVLFWAGRPILVDAAKQTWHLRANMNSLIALGTLAAFGWSLYQLLAGIDSGGHAELYFESAGMIITLILLGRYLEARSKGRAGEALRALLELAPTKATAVINGVEIEIDAASIQAGMVLMVRPGEKIAADGRIVEGRATIDESMLTGESVPVERTAGENVLGGSINGNTPFRFRVSAAGAETFLASVIRLVADAQGRKAPAQRLADRVAGVFVPIVLLIALATCVTWYLIDPASPLLMRSVLSVLIVACPCALGLATPTAIMAGTGRAARDGIIVRGGDILEEVSRIDTIVFDKTGTLTEGALTVAEVAAFGGQSERALLRLAGSLEVQSEHPVAKAIVHRMRDEQIEPVAVSRAEALPGIGMKGTIDHSELLIGSRTLMAAESIDTTDVEAAGEAQMSMGRTVVFVSLDRRIIGMVSLADKVRPEAQAVVDTLRTRMKRIMMLSGDSPATAREVAQSLGISEVEAGIRPEQKATIVEALRKVGHRVAMVGDGINDAPALANASVGIAIGSGTAVAIETAGVVLVRENLTGLPHLFTVAKFTMKVIRQNLFWAFFYNVLAIPLAAGVFYSGFGLSLSPMIAAAAMALSSLFVITNSLRLNSLDLS